MGIVGRGRRYISSRDPPVKNRSRADAMKNDSQDDIRDATDASPNRREFLARSAAALTLLASRSVASGENRRRQDEQPAGRASQSRESQPFAKVAVTRDPHLIPARIVQRSLLRTHVERLVMSLTGTLEAGAAWNSVLRQDDHILIKFNQSMANLMGTNDAMAAVLVSSLEDAGFAPDRVTLLEVPPAVRSGTGTRQPDGRWQGTKVDFGVSGSDQFCSDLDWATAVINVPFLKTHHRAVMTGCLKNLSHGLIRHPSRFHDRGCDPAIGEINATAALRNRVKLNLVNGLRVAFDQGPDASENELVAEGLLIAGIDPVACDTIGFRELNRVRAGRNMGPLLPGPKLPPQLTTASVLGVGIADAERIRLIRQPDGE